MRSSALALVASSLGVAFGLASGCSLTLALPECEVDDHCLDPSHVCVANVCRAPEDGAVIDIGENVTEDTTWEAGNVYRLTTTIYVEPGATLTIRSGTRVIGEEGSALVVQAGAQLLARGTADAPVVFTSAQPEGERLPGDWGGVALLGQAPVNAAGAVLEGVLDAERAGYGGNDPTHSCGVLEYVRIEFAGFPLKQDEELNGLTLGGCGTGTLVGNVQVHFGLDDGVELFGGTVNLRNLVVTRAQDDSIDWDQGWTGAAQFLAIQQDAEGDNGFEASGGAPGATPASAPRIWNATLIGSGGQGSQRAMTLKEGTGGQLSNVLVVGHPIEAIDVQDAETVAQLESGALRLDGVMLHAVGAGGSHYFPLPSEEAEGDADDDMGFDEDAFFRMPADPATMLTFDVNPNLTGQYNLAAPGWVPQGNAVIEAGSMPGSAPFDGFDEQAAYAGAFAPGTIPWTMGWTAYPAN